LSYLVYKLYLKDKKAPKTGTFYEKDFEKMFLASDRLHHMNFDPGVNVPKDRIGLGDFDGFFNVSRHDMKISGNNFLRLIEWTVFHYPVLIRYDTAPFVKGRGTFQLARFHQVPDIGRAVFYVIL
jgi:hypothetical protein